jgi:hypothetical protein
VPELRPRRVGELLDLLFEFLRSRFATYVGISALLWLPMRAAQPFLGLHNWLGPDGSGPSGGFFLGFLFNTFGSFVMTSLEVSVLAVLVSAEFQGRPVSGLHAIRHALGRLFAVALIAVLGGVLTSIGCLCFAVPGIVLMWLLYLAPALCVIEDLGVAESFSRSVELAGRRFVPWIPYALATFLVGLPFASLAGLVDNPDVRSWMIERLPLSASVFGHARWVEQLFVRLLRRVLFLGAGIGYAGGPGRRDLRRSDVHRTDHRGGAFLPVDRFVGQCDGL